VVLCTPVEHDGIGLAVPQVEVLKTQIEQAEGAGNMEVVVL
jgi:hypothetical protein